MGVEALLSSLRAHTRRALPVVVLTTDAVSPRVVAQLRALGAEALHVPAIANPHAAAAHVAGWVNSGYTKLQIWGLTQFKKVVFLDADCLVVETPTKFSISGIDKQKVGETAAKVKKLRKPDPYKGKGIRFEGEVIRRKAGKAGK